MKIQNNRITPTSKIWSKDNSILTILILAAIFLVYFTPNSLARIIFPAFLIAAYVSKKNYLWIAFLFIIMAQPGDFFSGQLLADPQRIPLYTITSGVSLKFEELFVMVLAIKSFVKFKNYPIVYKKNINNIFFYLIILLVWSAILGMGIDSLITTARNVLPWVFILVLPRLLQKEDNWINLSRILFPFSPFLLFAQLYHMTNGKPLVALVKSNYLLMHNNEVFSSDFNVASRVIESPFLLFFIFLFGIIFLIRPEKVFPRIYNIVVIFSAFLVIFLSATRGWIIAFSFIGFVYFSLINSGRNLAQKIMVVVVVLLILNVFMQKSELFRVQSERVLTRFSSMEFLVQGDITAGGTLRRLSERSPRVMKKFRESPLIGFGFSDEFYEFADGHVGNQTLLLNIGIFGFLLVLGLLYRIARYIFGLKKFKSIKKVNSYNLMILLAGVAGIFIIHSSSTQMIGFNVGINKILLITLILSFTNLMVIESIKIIKRKVE